MKKNYEEILEKDEDNNIILEQHSDGFREESTYYNGKLRLYFNARNVSNNLTGRESIGIYEAEV